jgi:DNA polymerase II small subunit/DNA polymerase delta subunit B
MQKPMLGCSQQKAVEVVEDLVATRHVSPTFPETKFQFVIEDILWLVR